MDKAKEKTVRRIEGHTEMMVWNVPIEMKNKFKAKCIVDGVQMRERIIALMQKDLDND